MLKKCEDLFEDIEFLKVKLIETFSKRSKQCKLIENFDQRDLLDIFEFFKIADELKEAWFEEWLNSVSVWDIILSDDDLSFVYMTNNGKPVSTIIKTIKEDLIILKCGGVIDVNKLNYFGIHPDKLELFLSISPWIKDKNNADFLSQKVM